MVTRRGVRPGVALGVGLVVALLSWGLWTWWSGDGTLVPRPSWLAAVLLLAMAAFIIGWARPVRRYVRGESTRSLDPLRAARVVALAQAGTLTGAAAAGWYAGQLAVALGDVSLVANQDRAWRLVVMVVAGVVLCVAGLVGQRWCTVDTPPED